MLTILGKEHSLVSQFVAELRDNTIQQDRMRFRRNLERLGQIFAYEISKTLLFHNQEVNTPLGVANSHLLSESPVIATILRAGLPFHQGLLSYYDNADNAFVSAYRKHNKDGSFHINIESISSPNLNNRTLILSDPMLASGQSMEHTYKALLAHGKPAQVHLVAVLASADGLTYLKRKLPGDINIWVAVVDDELTAQAYIVPGLGDAGDLAFGKKH